MPRDRVDFHGRYSLKKKSLIKPEGSLVRLRPIHDDSQSYQFERLFHHKYTHSERFSIRSPRPSVLRRVNGCFLALRDMWSKVEERSWFPTRCPILHTGEYYHFLNDNGALWMWGAVECRAIGLHIFALLPIREKKGSEETNSVKVVSCVKVLAEWGKKVLLEHSWNVWYFHQNIRFMSCCMEWFCGHYLTWITLGLNTSFLALSIWCKANAWPWRAI